MRSRNDNGTNEPFHRQGPVAACLLISTLIGCAYAPQAANMVPSIDASMYANSGKSIGVQSAAGGQWSDPIVEGSKIDPMSFTDALIQALRRSNLFSAVNPEADPDYVLSPVLLRQSQPVVGLDMTVTLAVHYTLTETNDSSVVVLEREIESRYTATLGDAFVGAKRVAKANEGAVRENLRQLVDQLALTVGSSTGSGPMEDRSRRAASPWPDTSAVND